MTSTIKRVTPNYSFRIPVFDAPGWGTEMDRNFGIIDAAIYLATGLRGIKGVWLNSTQYTIGDLIIDQDSSDIWRCLVSHLSPATGTFEEDRTANPARWDKVAAAFTAGGEWQPTHPYGLNQFVSYQNRWAIVVGNYVSSASFQDDIDNGDLIVLLDLTTSFASQAQAEAGVSNTTFMSPLRTAQYVAAQVGVSLASKAQGDKADTAVQPGSLSTVATSGQYADLLGKPTLGTAAATAATDYATAAQGLKADSAVQTVTGGVSASVDNTDPQNLIVNFTGLGTGDMLGANNLSEVTNQQTARNNIGLAAAAFTIVPTGIINPRRDMRTLTPKMFGAVGGFNHYLYTTGEQIAVNSGDNAAIQSCIDAAAAYTEQGKHCRVLFDDVYDGGSHLDFGNEVILEWEEGATIFQTAKSLYGGFMLSRSDGATYWKSKRDVHFIRPQIDGRLCPKPKRYQITAISGDKKTYTLSGYDGALLTTRDVGSFLILHTGQAGINGITGLIISAVDVGAQTVTFAQTMEDVTDPDVTTAVNTQCIVGWNDLAIGFQGARYTVEGGHIQNYPWQDHVRHVNGAKAINYESGCSSLIVDGLRITNVGHGVYLQPLSGYDSLGTRTATGVTGSGKNIGSAADWTAWRDGLIGWNLRDPVTGEIREIVGNDGVNCYIRYPFTDDVTGRALDICKLNRNTEIIWNNIILNECGTLITAHGPQPALLDDGAIGNIILTNIIGHNCGDLAPGRHVGTTSTNHMKGGVINLAGGTNLRATGIKCFNDPQWPYDRLTGWPLGGLVAEQVVDGTTTFNSKPHFIAGAGRNCYIEAEMNGDVDALIHIGKGSPMGRDGPTMQNAFGMDLKLKHRGTARHIIWVGHGAPVLTQLTGTWDIHVGDFTGGVNPINNPSTILYDRLNVILRRYSTNERVTAKFADLPNNFNWSLGNGNEYVYDTETRNALKTGTIAATGAVATGALTVTGAAGISGNVTSGGIATAKVFQSETFVLAAGTATSFTPAKAQAMVLLSSASEIVSELFSYRAGGSPYCERAGLFATASSNTGDSTAVLTGTIGPANCVNVSAAADGKIYVENRRAVSHTLTLTFFG